MKKFYNEYPDIAIPEILQGNGWFDTSWHNDVTASSEKTIDGIDLRVWVFHDDPTQREYDFYKKFFVVPYGQDGCDRGIFFDTDSEEELAELIAKAENIIAKDKNIIL